MGSAGRNFFQTRFGKGSEPRNNQLDYFMKQRMLDYSRRASKSGCKKTAAFFGRCGVGALLLACLWVGSYLYFRGCNSFGGSNASASINWLQINYDEHYCWSKPLFYLHQPLAWLDRRATGTEVRMWINNFHGDRSNYSREAFN